MDERKWIKNATNIEKYNICGALVFRTQYKSERKKTNVVESLDKKFKNWYNNNDKKERGDFFDNRE